MDIEWLLRQDDGPSGGDEETYRELVREAGSNLGDARSDVRNKPDFRRKLVLGWLEAMRKQRQDCPGIWFEDGFFWARWALFGLGFVVGIGTALAVLGPEPINVLRFVGVFFLLQFVVLLIFLIVFFWRALKPDRGPGPLHRLIALLAERLTKRSEDKTHGSFSVLKVFRARREYYVSVERWTLFKLAQWLGVGFNIGALVVTSVLIILSDFVFSWSTTGSTLDAGILHKVSRGLAFPWWWYGDAVPSPEVVAASQWTTREPFESTREHADQWKRFLVMGLVTYGLLPRLLALGFGSVMSWRALRAVDFSHTGYRKLFDRLLPASGWRGPDPDTVRGPAPTLEGGTLTSRPFDQPGAAPGLILWGSLGQKGVAIADAWQARFGTTPAGPFLAGGIELDEDDAAISEAVRSARSFEVAIVAGSQPTAEVLDFLRSLRKQTADNAPIIVRLIDTDDIVSAGIGDAEPDEVVAWKRSLGILDDVHLWVDDPGGEVS